MSSRMIRSAAVFTLVVTVAAHGDDKSHLVRVHGRVPGGVAVGVFGACHPSLKPQECVYTVEAVRYLAADQASVENATTFEAVCVDIGTAGPEASNAWSCSPVNRDGVSVSVDSSAGGVINALAGVAEGGTADVGGSGQIMLGLAVELPLRRRLRYPDPASSGATRFGGDVLADGGIGSVPAAQSVILSHTAFDGFVSVFVFKPDKMDVSLGYVGADGQATCLGSDGSAVPCPAAFSQALLSTASLAPGALDDALDFDEIMASLDARQDIVAGVSAELENGAVDARLPAGLRLTDRINRVFEIIEAELEDGENASAAAFQLFNKIKSAVQQATSKLGEIRDIVEENVGCGI